MVDAIMTSIKDLLKFKIISSINTGDKTQDSLISAMLLAIATFTLGVVSYDEIIWWIYRIWYRNAKELNKNTMEYYKLVAKRNIGKFAYMTWDIATNELFTKMMIHWYKSMHKVGTISSPNWYKQECYDTVAHQFAFIRATIQDESIIPIYVHNNHFMCLYRQKGGNILMAYNSAECLDDFVKEITEAFKATIVIKKEEPDAKKYLFDRSGNPIGTIFEDRTMDLFVSRHKKEILAAVDNFIAINAGKKNLGGYGSYNLGFMLHGEPGTGKTLLIKALSNYLKKSVMMIDMRKIKSRAAFEEIFKVYSNKYIYCLDEFDCVQGAIKARTNSSDEISYDSELKMLKERQLELLKVTATVTKSKDVNNPTPLEQEIESVEKRISDLENALTLDTVLTVLDGINEMRGRVIIATTNHLDAIDPALLRAGRFDLKVHLGKFNTQEIRDMLNIMFKETASAKTLKLIAETRFKEGVFAPVDVIYYASIHKNARDLIERLRA